MSNENKTAAAENVQTTQTEKTIFDPNLSFEEFETLSKGEKLSASTEQEIEQKDETTENSEVSESNEEQDEKNDALETKNQSDDEDELEESDEDSQEEGAKTKKKNGVQKRIGRLAKKLSEKDQLLSEKDKRIALLESQINGKGKPQAEAETETQTSKAAADGKPKPEDYATNAEYIDAVIEYRWTQDKKAADEAKAKESRQSEDAKLYGAHKSRIAEYKKTQSDYDQVAKEFYEEMKVNQALVPSVALEELILESDLSAPVMYELMTNPEELERINGLPALKAAKAFRDLEAKVEARISKQTSPAKTEKKTTQAPAPITPIGNKSAASVRKSIYDKDLSFEEFERLETERLNTKRG